MKLILRNKTFPLKSAKLSAAIPDPYWSRTYNPNGDARLFWSLGVDAEREAKGEMWGPRVYHENLHFPIRRWIEVAGQVVEWSERYDEESGEPNGGFYVVEHGDIPRARLSFFEPDGTRFRFEWAGVCDVCWDEEYGQDVPFSAAGWAEFTGVIVRGSESDTEETLRGRLAEYLDPRDFTQGPLCMDGHRYESGVKVVHALFSPFSAWEAEARASESERALAVRMLACEAVVIGYSRSGRSCGCWVVVRHGTRTNKV